MSDESPIPVEVDRIECAPLGRARPAVRITALCLEIESRAVVLAGEVTELQEWLGDLTAARDQVSEEAVHLRAELAQSDVARVAALSEAAGLRAELERLAVELAHARGTNSVGDDLSEAQSLLAEARSVTARLREANSDEH